MLLLQDATGIGQLLQNIFIIKAQVIILDIKKDDVLLIKHLGKISQIFYCDPNADIFKFFEIHNKYGFLDVLCNNAADDQRHDWETLSH